MHTIWGGIRQDPLFGGFYVDDVNAEVVGGRVRFGCGRTSLGKCYPLAIRRPTQAEGFQLLTTEVGQLPLRTPKRGDKVNTAGVRVAFDVAHKGDESAIGRPCRDEKCGWMMGQLHRTLLPDLLDEEIELELLFIAGPGENDLVPIRGEAGRNFKSGEGCERDDGQLVWLHLGSRSQQVTAN